MNKETLKIDVLTLFPEMFESVLSASILGRAITDNRAEVILHNFRDFAQNKHNKVDDYPYGGGAGLVLSVQPIYDTVQHVLKKRAIEQLDDTVEIIMMTPQGEPFTHKLAEEFATKKNLVFICGHYEGFDERVREHIVTKEVSIGDYVLTGGEIPSMAMIDATVRLLPDVIKEPSSQGDSFASDLLEYPQYTRPSSFNGWDVPEVLLSGHHENIEKWRKEESLKRTKERRPDLLLKKERE